MIRPIVRSSLQLAPLLAISIAVMWICCIMLGATLGLVFAGFALITLASPPASEVRSDAGRWAVVWAQAALVLPIVAGWIWATGQSGWPPGALGWLVALGVVYCASLAVVTNALSRLMPTGAAGGITTAVAMAWLSWPIWTTPWMTDQWARRLVAIHPLFAANSATRLNPWPQQTVMYRLTRLGQDVTYAMPPSPWPALVACLLIALAGGALLLGVISWRRRDVRKKQAQAMADQSA
jgi:hypothetical protein